MDEAIWSCKVGVAERTALPEGNSDSPMRDAVEIAYRELTGRDPDFLFSGWGAELDDEERAAVRDHAQTEREIAVAAPRTDPSAPDGWQGTPPAEGTRRKLIFEAIEECEVRLYDGHGGKLTDHSALDVADAVETVFLKLDKGADPTGETSPASEAMKVLDSMEIPATREAAILDIGERVTILADQLVNARRDLAELEEANRSLAKMRDAAYRGRLGAEGSVPAGTKELRIVLADNDEDSPQMLFVEIEDQDGRSLDFPMQRSTTKPLHEIVIPYGRDNAWVSELAYQVGGAATRPLLEDHPDYVFPAERVRAAVAELLTDFGIPRACLDCATEQIEHGRKEMAGRDLSAIADLEDRVQRVTGQREDARIGEDAFKAQRDAALHLLRWLIGDIIPADLISLTGDSR